MRVDLGFELNTFHETMLGLEYSAGRQPDIFSRACVEAYAGLDSGRYGYPFTQIFEPGVLRETALLEGVDYASLTELTHRSSAALNVLADRVAAADDLPVIDVVNLCSALVSISRFSLATRLVDQVRRRAQEPRDRFEVAWLQFVISNRCDDGADSPAAFADMRAAIDQGGIARGRILDVCTQGVVWYLKRKEIPEDAFRWSIRVGNALTSSKTPVDSGAVSAWYRGLAMLPAAEGRAEDTRRYMRMARDAADITMAERSRAYDLNAVKTYHESSLKEHMYVTRDLDAAVEAGRALIDLDPVWSASYGELAEAYRKFGKLEEAGDLYEKAVAAGPPYVGHHLLQAAECRVALGEDDRAAAHYATLARMAPQSERILSGALEAARRTGSTDQRRLEVAFNALGPATPQDDRAGSGS